MTDTKSPAEIFNKKLISGIDVFEDMTSAWKKKYLIERLRKGLRRAMEADEDHVVLGVGKHIWEKREDIAAVYATCGDETAVLDKKYIGQNHDDTLQEFQTEYEDHFTFEEIKMITDQFKHSYIKTNLDRKDQVKTIAMELVSLYAKWKKDYDQRQIAQLAENLDGATI